MSNQFTIRPLRKHNARAGIAGFSTESLDALGIEAGEYVSLEHDGNTVVVQAQTGAKRWQRQQSVFIDGQTRNRLDAAIDDDITIGTADVSPADSVTLALQDSLSVRGNMESMVRQSMDGMCVQPEQSVTIPFTLFDTGFGDVSAYVVETEPDGAVVIADTTTVEIDSESYESHVGDTSIENVYYDDIGGLDDELERVREMVELPMEQPELFERVGVDAPSGVLLTGPPGTGKTLMAKAVANEMDAYFTSIAGPEIVSKYYGQSEQQIRDIFADATENAPSVIFIDELDSIASSRDEGGDSETENRIVAQLLTLMDGLDEREQVTVIAATNRADAIDNALRRGGRFDREVEVGVPSEPERREILDVHTRNMPLGDSVDLDALAEETHGFVGADIDAMVKEAGMNAIQRNADASSAEVTASDFERARSTTTPSAMREVFVEVPDVEWSDVGGLDETKQRLREYVQWPMEHADVFEDMNIDSSNGALLYGPPGTGKTLLAKAVANESEANFIPVNGPEIISKWVGESEEAVREIFDTARENAPSVVFIDELDAIAGQRGDGNGNDVTERVVSQLLSEMDGLASMDDVTVVATSNRPDNIDSALLRAGRLDSHIHVPVPDAEARKHIFNVHLPENTGPMVDVASLAAQTDGYVGADIENVCQEARLAAARSLIERRENGSTETSVPVQQQHFRQALDAVQPSVTEEVRESYEAVEASMEQRSEETMGREDTRPGTFQ